MNKEQLREYEPFFGGYFVQDEVGRNNEYVTFRVKKQDSSGNEKFAILRNYTFECEKPSSGAPVYPSLLRKLITDTETMMRLKNCASVVKFYERSVVNTEYGYEFFILIQDTVPLLKKEDPEKLSKSECYAIASAVCDAIASFRSIGIVHRRICAGNIFIDHVGNYLLGDFGLGGTYCVDEDYMTPEEYRVSDDLSSVDIYQTGMLFYKLLNKNRAPFMPEYPIEISEENRKNAFMRRMNGETTGKFEGSTSEEEAIVLKACAYRPSERYRSISSLKGDIDALIRTLSPSNAHDYYAIGASPSIKVIKLESENDTFEEDEEAIVSDANSIIPDYIDDDIADDDESGKIFKALIISISVILVIALTIIVYSITNKKNNKNNTDITETTPFNTTESTEAPTAQDTTTVQDTEPSEEPTTEEPTEPTTQENTTDSTSESSSEMTSEEPTESTTETTDFQVSMIEVDVSKATVQTFRDENGRIDEIVIALSEDFGDSVRSTQKAILFEYNLGEMLQSKYVDVECKVGVVGGKSVTMCDIHFPNDIEIDFDDCNYKIVFPDYLIIGNLGFNRNFAVEFDAASLN